MPKRLLASIFALVTASLPLPGRASEPTSGQAPAQSTRNTSPSVDAVELNPGAVTFPGLTRYVDLKGFYSVLMNGSPEKKDSFELKGVNYSTVANQDKLGTWSVSFADIPDMGNPPYDTKKVSLVVNEQPKAYIEKIDGTMQSLKAHAKFGYQFRDIQGRITGGHLNGGRFRINCYLAGRRMFIVSAEGKEDWIKSERTNAFFNSFEVPGATASPKLLIK